MKDHRLRRSALAAASVLGVAALALSGCSGSQQGAATLNKSAKVTIQMWSGQEDTAENALEKLAKQFEKAHPNVTIQVSPGASSTDELLQKLSAGFAGGQYPDISYAFGSWAGNSSRRVAPSTSATR